MFLCVPVSGSEIFGSGGGIESSIFVCTYDL